MTRDSVYGSSFEAAEQTARIASEWDVGRRVSIINERDHLCIGKADIVTNLGSVRPIDSDLIKQLKSTAVIPLMFETWEFRPQDLDLRLCRDRGIPVLGTNENAPELGIFSYLGSVVFKLLHECEIEVHRSNLIVVGSGIFGQSAANTLRSAGAIVVHLENYDDGGILSNALRSRIPSADALVVIEHLRRKPLLEPSGDFSLKDLKVLNPALTVIHVAGNVDREALETAGIRCWPQRFAPAGYMSVTTAYVGPKPLIDLHVGGLKVGELLARARLRGCSREESEVEALQSSICQAFPPGTPDNQPT